MSRRRSEDAIAVAAVAASLGRVDDLVQTMLVDAATMPRAAALSYLSSVLRHARGGHARTPFHHCKGELTTFSALPRRSTHEAELMLEWYQRLKSSGRATGRGHGGARSPDAESF
jgi:hypothetical protein